MFSRKPLPQRVERLVFGGEETPEFYSWPMAKQREFFMTALKKKVAENAPLTDSSMLGTPSCFFSGLPFGRIAVYKLLSGVIHIARGFSVSGEPIYEGISFDGRLLSFISGKTTLDEMTLVSKFKVIAKNQRYGFSPNQDPSSLLKMVARSESIRNVMNWESTVPEPVHNEEYGNHWVVYPVPTTLVHQVPARVLFNVAHEEDGSPMGVGIGQDGVFYVTHPGITAKKVLRQVGEEYVLRDIETC